MKWKKYYQFPMRQGTWKFNRCQSLKALVHSASSRKLNFPSELIERTNLYLLFLFLVLFQENIEKSSSISSYSVFSRKPLDHRRDDQININIRKYRVDDSQCGSRVCGEAEEDYFTSNEFEEASNLPCQSLISSS